MTLGANSQTQENPITGKAAYADYKQQKPGTFRKITAADLPAPHATSSVDNGPDVVARPHDAWPKTLPGFKVELYAADLDYPRLLRTAPNGDIFLAESHKSQIRVFRGVDKAGKAISSQVFADGLNQPFGIAVYPPGPNPQWVYVGNTDSVVRFPYQNGDLKARGAAQKIADLPGGGHLRGGGHWTRDIAFSLDGKKMYVSVGSHSNNDDTDTHPEEKNRADILEFNPDGSGMRVYASGLRNAVGIAVNPTPENFGLPRTSATNWAMIFRPTTSRMFRKTDFMAGRGTTSVEIRTQSTRESIQNSKTKSLFRMFWCSPILLRCNLCFIRANSFRRSITVTSSPRSTDPGTGNHGLDMK